MHTGCGKCWRDEKTPTSSLTNAFVRCHILTSHRMLTMKMKYATEYNPADNGVFVEINVKDSRLTDTPPEPQEQS